MHSSKAGLIGQYIDFSDGRVTVSFDVKLKIVKYKDIVIKYLFIGYWNGRLIVHTKQSTYFLPLASDDTVIKVKTKDLVKTLKGMWECPTERYGTEFFWQLHNNDSTQEGYLSIFNMLDYVGISHLYDKVLTLVCMHPLGSQPQRLAMFEQYLASNKVRLTGFLRVTSNI